MGWLMPGYMNEIKFLQEKYNLPGCYFPFYCGCKAMAVI